MIKLYWWRYIRIYIHYGHCMDCLAIYTTDVQAVIDNQEYKNSIVYAPIALELGLVV